MATVTTDALDALPYYDTAIDRTEGATAAPIDRLRLQTNG